MPNCIRTSFELATVTAESCCELWTVTSAPALRRILVIWPMPRPLAVWSAVFPDKDAALTLAPSRTSSCAITLFPFSTAWCRGVRPLFPSCEKHETLSELRRMKLESYKTAILWISYIDLHERQSNSVLCCSVLLFGVCHLSVLSWLDIFWASTLIYYV